MLVIGQRPGILVLIQDASQRPIWFKVISDPKDPQGCFVGQGTRDRRMRVMLAFFAAPIHAEPSSSPWDSHTFTGPGEQLPVRTQNELTAPAQTLLLPKYQGRNSSFPPMPLIF